MKCAKQKRSKEVKKVPVITVISMLNREASPMDDDVVGNGSINGY